MGWRMCRHMRYGYQHAHALVPMHRLLVQSLMDRQSCLGPVLNIPWARYQKMRGIWNRWQCRKTFFNSFLNCSAYADQDGVINSPDAPRKLTRKPALVRPASSSSMSMGTRPLYDMVNRFRVFFRPLGLTRELLDEFAIFKPDVPTVDGIIYPIPSKRQISLEWLWYNTQRLH